MTCKDCIHFEVCDSGRHIGEYIEDDGVYTDGVEKECPTFKLGADVVSVVRCKDCKHGQRNGSGELIGHYICEYNQYGPLKHPYHYCSSGERYGDEK